MSNAACGIASADEWHRLRHDDVTTHPFHSFYVHFNLFVYVPLNRVADAQILEHLNICSLS